MGVGAVLCARSERSAEGVHGTGAERQSVAAAMRSEATYGSSNVNAMQRAGD